MTTEEHVDPKPSIRLRDHVSTHMFEFAVACCVITPLVLARFSSASGYTYTFPFGRRELSPETVAGAFSPLGLAVLLIAWALNRSRKRRELAMCAGVLLGHCGLMYGLPLLPPSATELPILFYLVLTGALCITLILTAYVDQRKRGPRLGFVLGLFFSPAIFIVNGLVVTVIYTR